jgi:hypothetical protein
MTLPRLASIFTVAAMLFAAPARATVIEFDVSQVAGTTWQYDYFIASGSFDAQQGFVVFFDETLYSNLQLASATPDWDALVVEPDTILASDGTYDALALVNGPAFTGAFSVTFTWLGIGLPGAQPFEKYFLDVSSFPVTLEEGVTRRRRGVPEPVTLLLMAAGGTAWALRRKRASHSSARG